MKDIDFDELDQAVSSVLKTPDEQAAVPETAPSEAVSAPEESTTEPQEVNTEVASEPEAEPTISAKTPLAIKRRGQFMDVVHPSSDMTGKPSDTPKASTPKVTIRPISTSVEPEAPTDTKTDVLNEEAEKPAPMETTVPEVTAAPVETVEPPAADRAWPDPLDVMETQEETQDAADAPKEAMLEDTAVEAPVSSEADPEATGTTPFLSDTNVDKRPLDAFSAEEVPATDPAALANSSEPLPPELQPDVVAVESSAPEEMSEKAEEHTEPVPVEKTSTPEPSFNASIPQQYVASENQADEDHSLFDTKEYHQPLIPAKTKKRGLPGWLMVILTILLLAGLGAAGGYFWFFYGL